MKKLILFDTSILIAGFVVSHSKHLQAHTWLKRAKAGEFSWAVSAHTIAECYAVLTRLPLSPKISPAIAKLLIEKNIEASAKIISLSSSDYIALVKDMVNLGLTGGIMYDAVIYKSARKSKATHLLTLNPQDFHRFLPEKTDFIITP